MIVEELYMSKNNRPAGIKRREFMKVSGTAIAGAGALAQVGETQAKENNLFDTVKDGAERCGDSGGDVLIVRFRKRLRFESAPIL
jgi:hypothetical protein